MKTECYHYQQGNCQSCQWLGLPYPEQLERKQLDLQQKLDKLDQSQLEWLVPMQSELMHFRNKAKMVVSGSVERPILGILKDNQDPASAVDLTDCPLYPKAFQNVFKVLKDFIGRAGLVPYNIQKQKGELKYILLTESRYSKTNKPETDNDENCGDLMLRFVLRSENKLPLIQRELAGLLQKLPQLKVVSLNIQPQPAAILEGEKEIFLTEQQVLAEKFNQIPLYIRPQGFFQTNPKVAEGLYACAQNWIKHLPIQHLWDLFCGVGGFGLHCAQGLQQSENKQISLTGIEISPSAIYSAQLSANQLGLSQVKFQSLDAANFALQEKGPNNTKPELVIVNPPRRGIGKPLAEYLNQLGSQFLLYSSCNAASMATDLEYLAHYQGRKIQLFDMFPHTSHYEVLMLLELRPEYK